MSLPESWRELTIGELGEVVSGGTPPTKDSSNFGGDISWITPADLTGYKDIYIAKGRKSISEKGLKSSSARLIPADSVLFSSRAPIGYVAISSNTLTTNQGFKTLIPREDVSPKYVYYFLKSAKALAESYASGTTFKELSGTAFKKLPIPLAPLDQQEKIVAKIEELFSEIDASLASLNRTRNLLRHLHLSSLNTATKSGGRFKILGLDDLLQEGKASLKTGPFGTLISKEDYEEAGIPIIGIENIGELKFIGSNFKKYISQAKYNELKSYEVAAGDILISRSGTVGEICVVPEGIHGIISTNLIRVRVNNKIVLPEYFIALFKGSSYVTAQIKELCRGSSRLFLNQGIMKQIKYPIPSIDEQAWLLEKLNDLIYKETVMTEITNDTLAFAVSLKQSILAEAFKGELV